MQEKPKIVYKYLNWNDADSKKILTENELYFCNAQKWKNYGEYAFKYKPIDKQVLHDSIEKEVYEMRNKNFPLFEKWFNIHLYKYKIDFGEPQNFTAMERDLLWEPQMVDNIVWHRTMDIIKNPEEAEISTRKFYYKRTGIFSTSKVKNSNQLWEWKQTYQQKHNGNAVCIGLDLTKIKKKLDCIGNYSLGQISYQDSQNEIDFIGFGNAFLIDRLNSITFTLAKNSVDNILEQQELRIMKFLTGDISKKSPERFLYLEPDFLTEIIVHSNATNEAKEEIESISKKNGCNNLTYFKQ